MIDCDTLPGERPFFAHANQVILFREIAVNAFWEVIEVECQHCGETLYLPTTEMAWQCPTCTTIDYAVLPHKNGWRVVAVPQADPSQTSTYLVETR